MLGDHVSFFWCDLRSVSSEGSFGPASVLYQSPALVCWSSAASVFVRCFGIVVALTRLACDPLQHRISLWQAAWNQCQMFRTSCAQLVVDLATVTRCSRYACYMSSESNLFSGTPPEQGIFGTWESNQQDDHDLSLPPSATPPSISSTRRVCEKFIMSATCQLRP